jgi:hypothetical protein
MPVRNQIGHDPVRTSADARTRGLAFNTGTTIGASGLRSCTPGNTLDPANLRVRYEHLERKVKRGIPNLVIAKRLIDEVTPILLQMEATLAPSVQHDKDALRQAGLPSWSTFLLDFSQQIGYSLKEIHNLLREYRGLAKIAPKAKGFDHHCREMLTCLIEQLEFYGDRVPVLISDLCRSLNAFLGGAINITEWRRRKDLFCRLQTLNAHVPSTAMPGCTPRERTVPVM